MVIDITSLRVQHKQKPGKQLANADALSRLPLSQQPQDVPVPGDINLVLQHLNNTPVTATEIKTWTDKDPLLSKGFVTRECKN